MIRKKKSDQSNSNFRQQESAVQVIDKKCETTKKKQFLQTTSTIESPQQETGQEKLQKQSFKLSQHTTQEFQQQESAVHVVDKKYETAKQKQYSQTTSTIESPQQDTGQEKLQKQSSKLFQYTTQEFQQPESTAKVLNKTFETAEQKQYSQATSTIGSPQQKIDQGKLQKQSFKLSQHTNQEFYQPESTVKALHKKQETAEQKQFSQIISTIESPQQDTGQGKLQKQSSKVSQHSNQEFQQPERAVQRGDNHFERSKQKQVLQNTSVLQSLQETGQEKLQKQSSKQYQQKQVSQMEKSILKENEKKSKKLFNDNPKVQKGIRFIGKLGKNSLIATKAEVEKSLIDAKNSLQYGAKTSAKTTKDSVKGGIKKYQKALEQGDDGVKIASQSATKIARATKKLVKNRIKTNTKLGKMGKQKGKLIPFSKDNKKLKVESRTILKKKAMKKKMYYMPLRDKNKARALTNITFNARDRIVNLFKSLGKFKLQNIQKMIGTKVVAILGGGVAGALPIILMGVLCLIIAGMFGAGSSSQEQMGGNIGASKNLSLEVEKWRALVEKEATAQGMEAYVNLLLAIIQVESGGTGTPDIMQSSESAGYDRPNVFQTEEESVRQGVKHLKECLLALKAFNMGYENNVKALAQAYNYGNYFATWLGKRGGEYNLEVAEEYSRTIVAPSLGNTTGRTMSYVNETSLRLGKPYKYINGGNFFYGELISEYIGGSGANISGDFRKVLVEIEKYQGWEYVWGGKNPTQGFDCSGLTSWGLKQIGIDLPSYALTQYELTEPIQPSEAQPGDLIFFRGTYGGPDHISHVAFYIDENTMFDSQSAGIGYHNWKTSYWQQHFAGIHRVKR
ncbi:lysozyme family protein [Bacillus thuringiensis]|uniref:bifunctional lytic transglycosylase/C40 family peptidase n=1 Tax=Bacillus thuringiensis TaxID=1428 RepID=UPI0021B38848|nr:bifunctional lytic transglycosylase/C40 family peptidase [Bacillus thuringiensis]